MKPVDRVKKLAQIRVKICRFKKQGDVQMVEKLEQERARLKRLK